jgi:hypothetical protein
MKIVLASILALAAGQAAAQDIGYKMDRIKAGSTNTFKNFDGMVNTHVFEGKVGEHYVYKTYNGPDASFPWIRTRYTTPTGELVRAEIAGGEVLTYEPHNCVRTLGSCSYTVKSNARRPSEQIRFTEVDGDTLTFSVTYGGGKVYYTGTGEMGEHGWPTRVTVRWKTPPQIDTEEVIGTDFK